MSTSVSPVTEQEWHAARRLGIGGSEVHHLFPSLNLEDPSDIGSRYGCPRKLSYEKLGVEPDFAYTPKTLRLFERGHLLEDIAADKYVAATGRKVFRSNFPFVSETHPFMRCNIDRRIKMDERGKGVLECKSANSHVFVRMQVEGLPIGYALQIQHSIETMRVTWGAFAVVESPDYMDAVIEQIADERLRRKILEELAPTLEFKTFEVERDDNLIGVMVKKEQQFWSLVEQKKLADPLPDMKDDRCKSCVFRKTCRGAQFAEANNKIVRDKGGVKYTQIENAKFAELAADRITLMKQIDELSETMKAVDNEIKQSFPAETGAVQLAGTDIKIRWNYQKGATRWDSEALNADAKTIGRKIAFADFAAERIPELVAEFQPDSTPSLADKYQTHGAPGRPFVFSV